MTTGKAVDEWVEKTKPATGSKLPEAESGVLAEPAVHVRNMP